METHIVNPQNADGTPHFAYFDLPTQLSFVWNGNFEQAIEVCWGGYAEPVIDHIEPRNYSSLGGGMAASAADWLNWFKVLCDLYIESHPPPVESAIRKALGEGP